MGLVTSKNIPQFVAPSRNRRFLNSPIANLNSFDLVDYINYSICIKTGPWSGRKFAVTCGNVQCIDGVKSKSSTMAVLYRFVASILAANARETRDNVIGIAKKLVATPYITLPSAKPPFIISK